MRVLIISDVHANWPALQAVLQAEMEADQILCLGDLVNYGPQPAECVAWAIKKLHPKWVAQGNHDHAVGLDVDPHCSPAYVSLAKAMQEVTSRILTPEFKAFLGALSPLRSFHLDNAKCVACHATPRDQLHRYVTEQSPSAVWEAELITACEPDFLFLGHTHLPMKTRLQRTVIVNPGSVGQPKDGDPRASYALWEDGDVSLRRVAYDVEETIRAYANIGLESQVAHALSVVLRTGGKLPTQGI